MKKTLVIENLPNNKSSQDVSEMISSFGKVNWVYLKQQPERNSQLAYIDMAEAKDAARIIVKWNGYQLDEKVLRVKYVESDFDHLAALSDGCWSKEQAELVKKQQRLDVRELASLAKSYKAKKRAEANSFKAFNTESPMWWPKIFLIMIIISSLIYLYYYYTRVKP